MNDTNRPAEVVTVIIYFFLTGPGFFVIVSKSNHRDILACFSFDSQGNLTTCACGESEQWHIFMTRLITEAHACVHH